MELDELKYLFLQLNRKMEKRTDTDVLVEILKRKSAVQTGRLKRNLRAELSMATLFCFFPVYILASYPGAYLSVLAIVFLLIAGIFIIKISKLLKAIQRYETSDHAIKQRLRLLVKILRNSARLYIQSTIISFPLLFGLAALLIQLDNSYKDPLLFLATPRSALIVYGFSSICWCIAMYFFTRYYVKKKYGQHISQLESHLKEID